MKLTELIEALEVVVERVGEDQAGEIEVRLMTQPHYPFENSIEGVVYSYDMDDVDGLDTEEVVYLTEGAQLGYGNKKAWDV